MRCVKTVGSIWFLRRAGLLFGSKAAATQTSTLYYLLSVRGCLHPRVGGGTKGSTFSIGTGQPEAFSASRQDIMGLPTRSAP
jgi:hypothetical protein